MYKILVVDDDKEIVKAIEIYLGKENYEIIKAYDGEQALKEIKKNNLYDGPIIALTANALTGMREKYIEHGFTDYLSKPIEKSELNRILKTYLTK